MWYDYAKSLRKNNRAAGGSIRLAAFISAVLLSLLCGLFYNAWKYEVERIVLEEGGWQSRITGELGMEQIKLIKNFASIRDVKVNTKESKGTETAADLYFDHYGAVLKDTPRIAKLVGVPEEKAKYHYALLAMYLVRDAKDTAPRLLFPMFLVILCLASCSLVVIIYNSFAVSMNARVHQFGIFSSVGATPRQIRACLLQEACFLCALPAGIGNLLGIAGSMGLVQLTNVLLGSGLSGRHQAVFGYHPLVLLLTLLLTALTVWLSAWLPARKLSRLTPLEAIKNTAELQLERKKKPRILAFLFGVEGELAANALKAQKKALRTASLSLIASFLAFIIMQCFFAASSISTRETYFERYQDVWDIMVTVKDVPIEIFGQTDAVQRLAGVKSAVVYQKASAKRILANEELSEEMLSFGGFSHASKEFVTKTAKGWLVNAPLVILDDRSFSAYCGQLGIAPRLDGAVVLNRIRDVTNPDFRHPRYMPYLKAGDTQKNAASRIRRLEEESNEKKTNKTIKETTAKIPVLAYTQQAPVLREEYATRDYYELVHILPVSLWKQIKGQIAGTEKDVRICICADDREHVTAESLHALQSKADEMIGGDYKLESENRIQEYETNRKQIQGMRVLFGGFCVLLALIGIGDVFSNTLGFVRQRKREFARYLSIGLTPKEMRRMFCIEAFALACRPLLIACPLAALAVGFMLKASYLGIREFLKEAPWIPVSMFLLFVAGAVMLAYFMAWNSLRKLCLAEVLRDDTLL